MRCAVATLAVVATLALAEGAGATQRYAAPGGSGVLCVKAAPCSLKEAMENAKADDEVIVGTGVHTLPSRATLSVLATNASVHGDFGGPRPTVAATLSEQALYMPAPGSRLSYLTVVNNAAGAGGILCAGNPTIERVEVFVTGTNSQGVQQRNTCTVRDSVIRASGSNATALFALCEFSDLSVRNLTAIAGGVTSVGIRAVYASSVVGPACSLQIKNSIASGGLSDLRTTFGVQAGNIAVSNSNFDLVEEDPGTTIEEGPGNQTASPQFVNPAAGNYRQAPGSPTVDAGMADPLLGALDLDGNPRVLGAAPDIGAFEYVPPPPAIPAVPPGRIASLKVRPRAFRVQNRGGAIVSAKKKRRAPVTGRVAYSLSAATTVTFTTERKLAGRRVGKRCVKRTRANRKKKRCARFRRMKPTFAHSGVAGVNRFRFSGRLNRRRALRPGRYRLVGRAGGATMRASFRIVR